VSIYGFRPNRFATHTGRDPCVWQRRKQELQDFSRPKVTLG